MREYKSYKVVKGQAKGKTIEKGSVRWAAQFISAGIIKETGAKEEKKTEETKELKTTRSTKGRKSVRSDD